MATFNSGSHITNMNTGANNTSESTFDPLSTATQGIKMGQTSTTNSDNSTSESTQQFGLDDTESITGVDKAMKSLEDTIAGADPLTNALLNKQSQENAASEAARTAAERQRMAQSGLSETAQMAGSRQTARDIESEQQSGFAQLGGQVLQRQDQAVQGLAQLGLQENQAKLQQKQMDLQEEQFGLQEEQFEFQKEQALKDDDTEVKNEAKESINAIVSTITDPTNVDANQEVALKKAWKEAYPGAPWPGIKSIMHERVQDDYNEKLGTADFTDQNDIDELNKLWGVLNPGKPTPTYSDHKDAAWKQDELSYKEDATNFLVGTPDFQMFKFNNDTNKFEFNADDFQNLPIEDLTAFEKWYQADLQDSGASLMKNGILTDEGKAWLKTHGRDAAYSVSPWQKNMQMALNKYSDYYGADSQEYNVFVDYLLALGDIEALDMGSVTWKETADGTVYLTYGDDDDVKTIGLPDGMNVTVDGEVVENKVDDETGEIVEGVKIHNGYEYQVVDGELQSLSNGKWSAVTDEDIISKVGPIFGDEFDSTGGWGEEPEDYSWVTQTTSTIVDGQYQTKTADGNMMPLDPNQGSTSELDQVLSMDTGIQYQIKDGAVDKDSMPSGAIKNGYYVYVGGKYYHKDDVRKISDYVPHNTEVITQMLNSINESGGLNAKNVSKLNKLIKDGDKNVISAILQSDVGLGSFKAELDSYYKGLNNVQKDEYFSSLSSIEDPNNKWRALGKEMWALSPTKSERAGQVQNLNDGDFMPGPHMSPMKVVGSPEVFVQNGVRYTTVNVIDSDGKTHTWWSGVSTDPHKKNPTSDGWM